MPPVCKHMHFKDVFDKMRKHDIFFIIISFLKTLHTAASMSGGAGSSLV